MKYPSKNRLTLDQFQNKQQNANQQLETYTKQVIASGLEQHLGNSVGNLGGGTSVLIRGIG